MLTDLQILKQYHRFIRDDDHLPLDTTIFTSDDYGNYLAKKYYDKLFKEFALIDLSQFNSAK